jgi:hypothetical protein
MIPTVFSRLWRARMCERATSTFERVWEFNSRPKAKSTNYMPVEPRKRSYICCSNCQNDDDTP